MKKEELEILSRFLYIGFEGGNERRDVHFGMIPVNTNISSDHADSCGKFSSIDGIGSLRNLVT